MKKRVVVAMSGGVDSSVAAAILRERGFEVIGITMCFNLKDPVVRKPRCCGTKGIEDARRVAHKLGINHYVVNMKDALNRYIISDFMREYTFGRTPNPCVRCNQFIKFGLLFKKADALGAEFLATGHYARGVTSAGRYYLRKARDLHKDQSYFLYRLKAGQLKRVFFPLGNMLKKEVRKLAESFGLAVADKPESQEICFLPGDNYREFIRANCSVKPGLIVNKEGAVLGRHKGVALYTIGQREGLGIAAGQPLYITDIDARSDKITVGAKNEAYTKAFAVKDISFINRPPKKKIEAKVRIRYNHREAPAGIDIRQGKAIVYFKEPQFAVTPGQSAVFYQKDIVLGGGIIERRLD